MDLVTQPELRTREFSYSQDFNKFKFDDKDRCYICNKVIKNPQAAASVHVINGGGLLLHPGDEAKYIADSGDMLHFLVGPECARKLGEFANRGEVY